MPRYVVLYHEMPPASPRPTHWDFMLESGAALRTWALAAAPQDGELIAADVLPDHRRDYLDYEGPVSGDRGRVTQWDAGEFHIINATDELVALTLAGRRLRGDVCLSRDSTSPADDQRWMFLFRNK